MNKPIAFVLALIATASAFFFFKYFFAYLHLFPPAGLSLR